MERLTNGVTVSKGRLTWLVTFFALFLGIAVVWMAANSTEAEAQQNNQPRGLIYGLLNSDRLIEFTKNNPGNIRDVTPITGLGAGETLIGMDFRPANGRLVGVTINGDDQGTVYLIGPNSGRAVAISTLVEANSDGTIIDPDDPTPVVLDGDNFGVDFNPTVDRLRVNSDNEQNLRINVNTGATIMDTDLAYSTEDPNEGADPNIVAAAYSNNVDNADGTVLYDIDSDLNILADQTPANDGTLNTIGPLGNNIGDMVGFDIRSGFGAVASIRTRDGAAPSNLVQINLANGNASNLGRIGGAVKGLAIPGPFSGDTVDNGEPTTLQEDTSN